MTIELKDGWLEDTNGNRASVAYYGDEARAREALASLEDCDNCINCSGCSDCSGCSRCSGCSDCSDCSGCSRCSGCSDCSRCSGCSDCSDCSGCSHVAYLYDKKDIQADPEAGVALGQPPIPKIENINQRVLEAVSAPGALNMNAWHTCNTTHCRAGWVVHLAGEAGYALEHFHNTALAAQMIYRESGSPINPGRFYDDNTAAMEDMRKAAEREAAGAP